MKVRTIFKDRFGGILERDLTINDRFFYGLLEMVGSGHKEDHLKLDVDHDYIFELEDYVEKIMIMETDICFGLKLHSFAPLKNDGSIDADFNPIEWMKQYREVA